MSAALKATTRRVEGTPPWFANVAEVITPAPALLDRLANEFAPIAAKMKSQTAYWVSFHMWVVDRLAGEELKGAPLADLREAVWAAYATSYWAMNELTLAYGVPPAVINLGMSARAPGEDSVADFVAKMKRRQGALDAGAAGAFALLPALMREEPTTGTIHGAAYNSSYCEVISEKPPLGEMPAHLQFPTGSIRLNARDFMRIDYGLPSPEWLKTWRTAFEIAVRANPEAFERIIVGVGDEKNLRAMWVEALAWGHNNWGGQSLNSWTQDYYEDVLHWSIVFNRGLEGVSLASFVALINNDKDAATRAVRANAIFLGSWGAAVMGLLDTGGVAPKLVAA